MQIRTGEIKGSKLRTQDLKPNSEHMYNFGNQSWRDFQISWTHSMYHQKQGTLWVTWYFWGKQTYKTNKQKNRLLAGLPHLGIAFICHHQKMLTFFTWSTATDVHCANQHTASPALKQALVRHEIISLPCSFTSCPSCLHYQQKASISNN